MPDEANFDPQRFSQLVKARKDVRQTEEAARNSGLNPDKTHRSMALVAAAKRGLSEKQHADKLEELLMVDKMTGLLSEHAMQARIDEKIAFQRREDEQARREKRPTVIKHFAVIFMDLNNLKQVNDLSPDQHSSGDALIRAFAEILKSSERPGDIVARREKGGDEFIVILEGSDIQGALKYWTRESKRFKEYRNAFGVGSIWVSAGVAEATADTIRDKIKVADRALRLAKDEAKSRMDNVNTIKTEIDLELQGK